MNKYTKIISDKAKQINFSENDLDMDIDIEMSDNLSPLKIDSKLNSEKLKKLYDYLKTIYDFNDHIFYYTNSYSKGPTTFRGIIVNDKSDNEICFYDTSMVGGSSFTNPDVTSYIYSIKSDKDDGFIRLDNGEVKTDDSGRPKIYKTRSDALKI